MKKLVIAVLSVFILAPVARSGGSAGYAGAFLKNGVGSRALGMGGAYTAVAEGPEAVYFNPAGLGYSSRVDFSSGYKALSLDRHLSFAAISFPIRNEATMAASWISAGVSDIAGRGNSRQYFGEISDSHNAFALSFAKVLRSRISFGVNLRYIQEKLDDLESFTIGVDIGVLGKPFKNVSIGAIIQNFGSEYRWESSKYWTEGSSYNEKFPVVMKFGVAANLFSNKFVPSIDFETSDKGEFRFRTGAEYWLVKKVIRRVEDEYEEGVYTEVEEHIRQAGIRIGLDRGNPTFGLSVMREFGRINFGFEYAFLLGQYETSAGQLFTLNLRY